MLTAIRSAASNWLGRAVLVVIMGLLIISFAIWGIGDIFRGGVNRTLVTIGNRVITADQFRTSFNEELRRISQQARRNVTTDEARAFGLDRALLNRMIDEQVLSHQADALGLALDQDQIVKNITQIDAFKTNGVFDRNRFADVMQRAGLTEAAFLKEQGGALLRGQILNGMAGGFAMPKTFGALVHQYQEEARDVDYLLLPASKAAEPAAPDDAALAAFYEERKAEFRTIETRKVTILAVSASQFASHVSVTEADIQAAYARAIAAGRFGTPEKRRAQRLLFENEAEAKAAAERLKSGTNIEVLLAEKKLTAQDVDLGLKSRAEMTGQPGVEAIFALAPQPGTLSTPMQDPFGFVLFRLVEVVPGQSTPLESVRTEITGEARIEKIARDPQVKDKLDAAFRAVEDQRIAGKSLTEAAQVAGLTAVVIPALDNRGGDGAGGRLSIAGGAETVAAVFASDIGLDNEPLLQRDGGHVWFEVNGIDLPRDKPLDEVKAEVRTRLVQDIKAKALAATALTLVQRIEAGTPLATIATEIGAPVQAITGLKRGGRDATLGVAGVERAFSGPIGKPVSAAMADDIGRIILLPKAARVPPYDAANDIKSGLTAQISQAMGEDFLAQYTLATRKALKVTINEALLAQALGQPTN